MPQTRSPARSRLDAMAKEQGYPSYAAMKAYQDKYQRNPTIVGGAKKKDDRNVLQKLVAAIPFPTNYAADRMRKAVKKRKKQ